MATKTRHAPGLGVVVDGQTGTTRMVRGVVIVQRSGGDTNISATTDALTLTEYAADVALDINITATTDALTLVEFAADVALDVDVLANTDALTLTEYQASVDFGVNVLAGTDALTLTEFAATITLDINVSAGVDVLTLTEYRATIEAGADKKTKGGGLADRPRPTKRVKDRALKAKIEREQFLDRIVREAFAETEPQEPKPKRKAKQPVPPTVSVLARRDRTLELAAEKAKEAEVETTLAAISAQLDAYLQWLDEDEDDIAVLLMAA